MVEWEEIRRLALGMPEATEAVSYGLPHWRVRNRGFVWERPLRRADLEFLRLDDQPWPVLGARVEDEAVKFALAEEDPEVFFTTPHFEGFAAILVRLDTVSQRRIEEVVADAWLAVAPKRLAADWLARHAD
ncbi:hypothetical protein GCM10017608_26380 [Agromyces luteolus]|uniref:MmcQ/YjbR family DNA-binding protein n=1 Tax=Agromyces luteolus TaxID=88373 RepID=A0A7C9LJ44_9MICO|nr:MmcQ/YjbR family DNA-binding protein [Agromyces luteolus]MUN09015.1 MmcQ/YjbR family DNA-binding protein [Agromyces luteolus]GLK28703.1 hypothetical protein GCM10017608_26380 [Agromyces luteolus]